MCFEAWHAQVGLRHGNTSSAKSAREQCFLQADTGPECPILTFIWLSCTRTLIKAAATAVLMQTHPTNIMSKLFYF